MKPNITVRIGVCALILLDLLVWYKIVFETPAETLAFHFLDVGQGDSELVVFPGNVNVMTDAGPDRAVVRSVETALGTSLRYIDLAIISHPQLDHFNGYTFLLDHYSFGAFLINGRSDTPGVKEWDALIQKIKEKGIPLVALGAGDKIMYAENTIDILSPNSERIQSAELNDTGIVELVRTPRVLALLTADIDALTEKYLVENFDIRADILKVAHHGSKFSSSAEFLRAVNPKLAVIGVGAKNSYGHPAPEALARIASSTSAALFRTDQNGTVSVFEKGNRLRVYAER